MASEKGDETDAATASSQELGASNHTDVHDLAAVSETPEDENEDSTSKVKPSSEELKEPLADLDWRGLEDRYLRKMNEFKTEESKIGEDYRIWAMVFEAWAMSDIQHENDRAHKRLRTRMEHVKIGEESLDEKREHYIKVVQAFKSALALLCTS